MVEKASLIEFTTKYPEFENWLSLAQNNVLLVDDALKHSSAKRNDLVQSIKDLERLGVGRFIIGRKGAPSRFAWAFTPSSLNEFVFGNSQSLTPVEVSESKSKSAKSAKSEVKLDLVKFEFTVREGVSALVKLPREISRKEAESLIEKFKTSLQMIATE